MPLRTKVTKVTTIPMGSTGTNVKLSRSDPLVAAVLARDLRGFSMTLRLRHLLAAVAARLGFTLRPRSSLTPNGTHANIDSLEQTLLVLRAQLLLLAVWLSISHGVFMTIALFVLGCNGVACITLACVCMNLCVPITMARTRALRFGLHLMSVAFWLGVTSVTLASGGLDSIVMFFLPAVCIYVYTTTSHRSDVLLWCSIVCMTVVALLIIRLTDVRHGCEYPILVEIATHWSLKVLLVLMYVGSSMSFFGLQDAKLFHIVSHLVRLRDLADVANASKSAFLTSMSHEMRTPLHGILGLSSLHLQTPEMMHHTATKSDQLGSPLSNGNPGHNGNTTTGDGEGHHTEPLTPRSQNEDYQTMKGDLSSINTLAQHLLDLINDILDLAKIEAGELKLETEALTVKKVVDDALLTVRAQAHARGLNLNHTIDLSTDGTFIGCPSRIRQVLVNLLSNAVKFTESGSITVHAQMADDGRTTAVTQGGHTLNVPTSSSNGNNGVLAVPTRQAAAAASLAALSPAPASRGVPHSMIKVSESDVGAGMMRWPALQTGHMVRAANPHVKISSEREQTAMESEPRILRITVTDTGMGMKPEDMGRLFKPFSQLENTANKRFKGTGIGLVISRKLARMMGGDLTVSSAVGTGSSFTLSVKLYPLGRSIGTTGVPTSSSPNPISARATLADFMSLNGYGNGNALVGNGVLLPSSTMSNTSSNRYLLPQSSTSPMNNNNMMMMTASGVVAPPTGTSGTLLVPSLATLNLGPLNNMSQAGSVVSSAATSPLGNGGNIPQGFATSASPDHTTHAPTLSGNHRSMSGGGGGGEGTNMNQMNNNNGTSVIIGYSSGHQSLHSGGVSTNSGGSSHSHGNGTGTQYPASPAAAAAAAATIINATSATATTMSVPAGRPGALSPISPRQGVFVMTPPGATTRLPVIPPSTYRALSASSSTATLTTMTPVNGGASVLQSPSSVIAPRLVTSTAAPTHAMPHMNSNNNTHINDPNAHLLTIGRSFTPTDGGRGMERAQSPASIISTQSSGNGQQRHQLQMSASITPVANLGGAVNGNGTATNSPMARYQTISSVTPPTMMTATTAFESKLNAATATMAHWPHGVMSNGTAHYPSSTQPLRTLTEAHTEEGSRSGMTITTGGNGNGHSGGGTQSGVVTPTSVSHHTAFGSVNQAPSSQVCPTGLVVVTSGNMATLASLPPNGPPLISTASTGSVIGGALLISPMMNGAAGGSALSMSGMPPLAPPIRILVVDDSVINVKLAVRMLRQLNKHWIVDTAVDGKQGFTSFQANRYDLVFMDCQMPIVDGFEATRLIRAYEATTMMASSPGHISGPPQGLASYTSHNGGNGAQQSMACDIVPIIALTASATAEAHEACLTAGMSDFISKPFTIDALRTATNKWLPTYIR